MAKQKPKPLFSVKHDFVASLDAFCHAAVNLYQAVDALRTVKPDAVPETLSKMADAFRDAALSDDENGV